MAGGFLIAERRSGRVCGLRAMAWLPQVAVCLAVVAHGTASAVNYTWSGGLTGTWNDTSKWNPTGAPTVTGDTADVNGATGTVVNLLTTGGTVGVGITVRSGNTLLGNGAEGNNTQRLGRSATLVNQGTIENAVIQEPSSATNTGVIQANGAGKFMNLAVSVSLTNTGGTLRAVSGGTLNIVAATTTLTGGTLGVDASSRLQMLTGAGNFTLNNVAVTNSGTLTNSLSINSASGDRAAQMNLNGTTAFDNFGTINVSLLSPVGLTSTTRTSQMVVANTAAFTNRSSGTLNIVNSTTEPAGTKAAYFQMSATNFNNEGTINITTTGTSTGTAQFRAPSVNFANAGTINVDGPLSSIQMAGRTFTQTAGSLSLIDGGTMTAGSVLINGGTLRGTGTIAAPVTIGGILSPGNNGIGTLSVSNSVTWNAGNSWLFQLGAAAPTLADATAATDSDLLNVLGAFGAGSGSSFTFDFADTGSDGWYKLVDYTSTTFSAGNFQASNVPSGKTATFVVDAGSTALYVQIVPEPGAMALAACGVATLFWACRRRLMAR
jgi:subtilase-type serine protease